MLCVVFQGIKSKYEAKQLGRGGSGTAAGASSVTAQKAVDSNGRLPLKMRKRKGAGGVFGSGGSGTSGKLRMNTVTGCS